MELFGINFGALFQNPMNWVIGSVGGILSLPVLTFFLDNITQVISDALVKLNRKLIDNIPITPLRDWLRNQQIQMLKRSIKKYQETIEKIKK